MNEGLKKLKNYSKVSSIHAYMYPLKKKFKDKYFFLKGADCWGWEHGKDLGKSFL